MPVCIPTSRQALVLNAYDRDIGYERRTGLCRGNRRIFEIEFLLKGKIDSVLFPPQLIEMMKEVDTEEVSQLTTWNQRKNHYPMQRIGLDYARVEMLFANGENNAWLTQAFERLSKLSTPDTLTFFYFTSHGEWNILLLDFHWNTIEYHELLEKISTIWGKKVIFLSACYGGKIMRILEKRTDREDFAVISTAKASQEGVNWNDDVFHRELCIWLELWERFSQIIHRIKKAETQMGTPQGNLQRPQSHAYFDTVL